MKYKHFCINNECPESPRKDVISDKPKDICKHCGNNLKQLGIVTNIVHKGTQESFNKMRR